MRANTLHARTSADRPKAGLLFCLPHSPHEAFKACSDFLDKANPDEQIGILVTDSILTYGVLSAVLPLALPYRVVATTGASPSFKTENSS